MHISGSSHIPSGELNEGISISGSGKIDGNVRCTSFSCSGAAKSAGDIFCTGMAKVSGAARFDKSLHAEDIHVSGSIHIGENCTADNSIHLSGSVKCGGNIKCTSLHSSGLLQISGGIEAEDVAISGSINCTGLLNAEKIKITINGAPLNIGSIGGSDIKIHMRDSARVKRLPLFSKLVTGNGLVVRESIEGDVIALEGVTAPLVTGRIVAIGAGCKIDTVQYSENIEISPDATVSKYEKI